MINVSDLHLLSVSCIKKALANEIFRLTTNYDEFQRRITIFHDDIPIMIEIKEVKKAKWVKKTYRESGKSVFKAEIVKWENFNSTERTLDIEMASSTMAELIKEIKKLLS